MATFQTKYDLPREAKDELARISAFLNGNERRIIESELALAIQNQMSVQNPIASNSFPAETENEA